MIESGHKKPQVAFYCHFFSVSSDVKWALILSCLSHPQQLCGVISACACMMHLLLRYMVCPVLVETVKKFSKVVALTMHSHQ